ncbi:MAG: M20/M25/M40 family metallo-hydrolase [Ignavibacteria bacterium]|nr:M20/M25/M40 family metallo-hydrolase [Ignavibacteria bacterium]
MFRGIFKSLIFILIFTFSVYGQSPQIIQLVNKVNKDSLSLFIRQLSGDTSCVIGGAPYTIVSRHKNQPGNDKAAQFIYEKFQSYGLQVQYESFSSTGKNVIATKQGLNDSQAYFVICAHYDDMPSGTTAPGADDNASGTATVLELARVFSQYNFNYTIKFICFDEEEQGLIGSNYYATQARNRNDSIIGVINLDMTAYDANNDGMVDVHSNSVANTSQIANEWINNIYQYGVNLTPRTVASQPYSDHYSFQQKNYGAILVIEYDLEFNPRYHTVNDKFQYLNMDYATKIAKVTAATAAEYAQIQSANIVNLFTSSGWNLISIPIKPQDGRKSVLFPSAVSYAYSYDNFYVISDTLNIGKGYWLKFNAAQSHQLQGQLVNQLQIPVKAGWNLIGTLNSNISTSSISTQPPNIISSLFYEYNGSYSPSNVLNPGKGYWVKCSQNGYINLVSSFTKIFDDAAFEIKNYDYELNFISNEKTMKLYLLSFNTDKEKFELPPVPPAGSFDVRFSNNSFVEQTGEDEKIININSNNPLTLQLRSNKTEPLLISYNSSGIEKQLILSPHERILLDENVSLIKLKRISLPQQLILYQNYPNPFNPTTQIKFYLPTDGLVEVNIYNLQGQLIQSLINEKLDGGFHSLQFDGSKLSSGLYFYELKFGQQRLIQKMLLVK